MNKKWIIIGTILILLAGGLFYFLNKDNNEDSVEQTTSETQPAPETPADTTPARALVYEAVGTLEDVSSSGSAGDATAMYYDDGSYELQADFLSLAQTTNGDFYEGWLVNQVTKEFFSTGVATVDAQGSGTNTYMSSTDHQTEGYDFYVLTLEPDDGDPAPAEHIVEGVLENISQ